MLDNLEIRSAAINAAKAKLEEKMSKEEQCAIIKEKCEMRVKEYHGLLIKKHPYAESLNKKLLIKYPHGVAFFIATTRYSRFN